MKNKFFLSHGLAGRFFLVLFAFFMIGVPAPMAKTNAEQFIADFGKRAIQSLTTDNAHDIDGNFLQLLDEGFDLDHIAHFIMGRYWRQFNPQQRAEFKQLFRQRLNYSYSARFKEYKGVIFTVKSNYSRGKNEIIETTIQKPGGPVTPVDWEVTKENKIHDVIVEGISMSLTMRSEYSAAYQNAGATPEAFLNSLK